MSQNMSNIWILWEFMYGGSYPSGCRTNNHTSRNFEVVVREHGFVCAYSFVMMLYDIIVGMRILA